MAEVLTADLTVIGAFQGINLEEAVQIVGPPIAQALKIPAGSIRELILLNQDMTAVVRWMHVTQAMEATAQEELVQMPHHIMELAPLTLDGHGPTVEQEPVGQTAEVVVVGMEVLLIGQLEAAVPITYKVTERPHSLLQSAIQLRAMRAMALLF